MGRIIITLMFAVGTLALQAQTIKPLSDIELDKYKMEIASGNFSEMPPIDYLRYLVTFKQVEFSEGRSTASSNKVIWMKNASRDWIKKEDVVFLMKYTRSVQECKPVLSAFSSYSCHMKSTIGIEALHLISLYKGDQYPSACSYHFFCSPKQQLQKADEFDIWWAGQ